MTGLPCARLVIADATLSEPMVDADAHVLRESTGEVLRGLSLATARAGAKEGVVAINESEPELIALLREAAKKAGDGCRLAIREVADFYPSWLPALLMREVTRDAHVPGAACCPCFDPEDVLILNVETLRDFAAAEDGKPVETRAVSVNGELVNARIGMAIAALIPQAPGPDSDERWGRHSCLPDVRRQECLRHRVSRTVLIVNGPMRGHVGAPDERVTATTRSVNVLAENHPAARRMLEALGTILARARAACNECGMCTGFCPQAQLGYPISPARIVRAVSYSRGDAADDLLGALHCAGCGLCDVVCPVTLAPSRIVGELKKRFADAGLEPSRAIALRRSTLSFPCRRMPRERLMARLAVKFECRNPKEIQIEGRSK